MAAPGGIWTPGKRRPTVCAALLFAPHSSVLSARAIFPDDSVSSASSELVTRRISTVEAPGGSEVVVVVLVLVVVLVDEDVLVVLDDEVLVVLDDEVLVVDRSVVVLVDVPLVEGSVIVVREVLVVVATVVVVVTGLVERCRRTMGAREGMPSVSTTNSM